VNAKAKGSRNEHRTIRLLEAAGRYTTSGRCAYCGATLSARRRGAMYCSDVCRKRVSRVRAAGANPEAQNIPDIDQVKSTSYRNEKGEVRQFT